MWTKTRGQDPVHPVLLSEVGKISVKENETLDGMIGKESVNANALVIEIGQRTRIARRVGRIESETVNGIALYGAMSLAMAEAVGGVTHLAAIRAPTREQTERWRNAWDFD